MNLPDVRKALNELGSEFGEKIITQNPAFTKALQSAGRCIRTETDRGVIVFVDELYAWDKYYACFPMDMTPKMTEFYVEAIPDFFSKKKEL